jgi:hypothetical protein
VRLIRNDTLCLLVQNPTTLYAYWELSERKRSLVDQHYNADWRELQPTLRLYDVTGLSFDGSASGAVRQYKLEGYDSCYLGELEADRAYVADLGIWNRYEQFIPLLRSNTVHTPSTCARKLEADIPASKETSILIILPVEYPQFSAYSLYAARKPKAAGGGDSE